MVGFRLGSALRPSRQSPAPVSARLADVNAPLDHARLAEPVEPSSNPQPALASLVRWANLAVWSLVALAATLLGIILIPLHLPGGFLIPIAPVIALAANFFVPKMLLAGTGWAAARFIPAVLWIALALIGSTPTGDGDLLISGDSHSSVVALAYLGLGALGAVLGIIFAVAKPLSLGSSRRTED